MVVLVPGMGDDVQAIKAGIMEIADIFVINKADHPGRANAWSWNCTPRASIAPIVRTVATEGKGIAELVDAVEQAADCGRQRPSRGLSLPPPSTTSESRSTTLRIASRFYESLGLAVAHRETVAHEKVDVAMLPAGDSRIELLEPTEPDSPIAKFLEKRGPGLHHVALRVPDLQRRRVAGSKPAGARL